MKRRTLSVDGKLEFDEKVENRNEKSLKNPCKIVLLTKFHSNIKENSIRNAKITDFCINFQQNSLIITKSPSKSQRSTEKPQNGTLEFLISHLTRTQKPDNIKKAIHIL